VALTFSELTDEVMFNAFEGAAFTVRAQRFLNEAVNEIGRRVGVFLKAYEVAPFDTTGTVTTTTPFFRVEEAWICQGPAASTEAALAAQATSRIAPISQDSGVMTARNAGTPTGYQTEHAIGDRPLVTIRVFPATTGGFLGIVGRALPVKMTSSTDYSGLGGEWDDALISFARSRCFRAEDDFQAAQVWMTEFEQHLRTMAKVKSPAQDGPIVTPGTWDNGGSPVSGGC
jgi:hypothetical protein